jgi:hypothetical protein
LKKGKSVKPLNNRELVQLWERGSSLHALDRGLLALREALPDMSVDSLADWPLGRRNTVLIDLRCACFGRRLRAWATCPHCAEKLEFELDGAVLLERAAHGDASPSIDVGGLQFRLPTTRDLASVLGGDVDVDVDSAAWQLVENCRIPDVASSAATRPPCALEDIEAGMARADPMAEILIELPCPSCGSGHESVLDIVSFFWTELEARAKRLLRDVHELASAYGWTEQVVLSLSEQRRALYLDMVRG